MLQRAHTMSSLLVFFFFFNDTATTEIYTLSLHDALPIWGDRRPPGAVRDDLLGGRRIIRSEEHTSELQSHSHLVCRLLLEKKKNTRNMTTNSVQRRGPHSKQREPSTSRSSVHHVVLSHLCPGAHLRLFLFFFFFKGSGPHRDLPSSPPRRSSD